MLGICPMIFIYIKTNLKQCDEKSYLDDFDEFVSKFYGHHLWSDYYNDTYDKDFCNDKQFKKYLTDEEYSYIECFNEKYHPAFWGSYHFGFYTKTGQVWFYKQEFLSDDYKGHIK